MAEEPDCSIEGHRSDCAEYELVEDHTDLKGNVIFVDEKLEFSINFHSLPKLPDGFMGWCFPFYGDDTVKYKNDELK